MHLAMGTVTSGASFMIPYSPSTLTLGDPSQTSLPSPPSTLSLTTCLQFSAFFFYAKI